VITRVSIATDEGNEFDFTALRESRLGMLNGAGWSRCTEEQKTARVCFELDQATRKLAQLVTILRLRGGARINRSELPRASGFVERLGRPKTSHA
jgi:hypothetical protein